MKKFLCCFYVIKMLLKLCFFYVIVKGDCGVSWGFEMLFFLRDCKDDIGGYFVNCYLFVEGLIEMDFILVRVGLFLVIEL